jgi:mRNA interferase MazF
MASFKQGDVVKVPFPYTDRATRQHRPALVVSSGDIGAAHGLLWVLMITSAENRGWPGDVPVSDLTAAGLPVASVIRTAKIATIEAADATRIGTVPAAALKQVMAKVRREMGIAPPAAAKRRRVS